MSDRDPDALACAFCCLLYTDPFLNGSSFRRPPDGQLHHDYIDVTSDAPVTDDRPHSIHPPASSPALGEAHRPQACRRQPCLTQLPCWPSAVGGKAGRPTRALVLSEQRTPGPACSLHCGPVRQGFSTERTLPQRHTLETCQGTSDFHKRLGRVTYT